MKQVIRASLLSLFLVASVSTHAGGTAPLIDHAKVSFSVLPDRALTPAKVREAIAASGLKHGWAVVAETPGHLTLSNTIRDTFKVVIDVTYDESGMQVDYVSSENLNFKTYKGVRYIHPKYNKWVNMLMQGVTTRLSY
ncbi:MAG: hypothetical protein WC213_05485 [Arenimonas sp.]|jgi:hypothetical protein